MGPRLAPKERALIAALPRDPGLKPSNVFPFTRRYPGAKALNVFPFTRRYLEAKPAFLKDLDVYASTLKNWAMLRNFW